MFENEDNDVCNNENRHLRYLCEWYDYFVLMGSVHSGKITWISFSVLFSLFSCLVRAQESLAWRLEQRAGISILHLALPPVVLRTTSDYQGGVIPYVESATYLSPAGSPDLPVLAYEVLLNDARGAELVASRAVDSMLVDVLLAPASPPKVVGRPRKPRIAGDVYKQDVYIPHERVRLSSPFYAEGAWRQTVYVYPFSYNPVRRELRAAKTFYVELKGVKHTNATHGQVRSLFTSDENGALLVVTPAHYLATLAPFIAWKRERGLTVETLIYGAPQVGYPNVNDTAALQQYIRTRYGKSGEPLKYVLLVGNRTEVPPLRRDAPEGVKGDSDQAYGQVVGDDPYNEVYIGRFSAYTTEHVKTQVDRVLWYERDMRHNEMGYGRGLCIASNEGGMSGDNNETDLEHTEKIRDVLQSQGYNEVTLLADQKAKKVVPDQVAEVVNKGVGVITYVGHGYPNRWVTSQFSTNDIQNLEPTHTYPVIFNVACDNGNMSKGRCFAETWQWAQRSGRPTGSIGINASSELQYWDAPMRGQDAMIEYFTKKRELPFVITLGGIMNAGMKDMLHAYESTPKSVGRITAETWNIFGDPSVVLRTRAPEVLSVSHPSELLVSERNFEVHCPGEHIQATLKLTYPSGEVYYDNADFTSGRARFLGLNLVKGAVAHITVWGLNKETYTADIPCIESSSSPLRIKAFRLKPKTFSATGLISAGETWEVWGTFTYHGTTPPLSGVRASLGVTPTTVATLTSAAEVVLPTFHTVAQEEEVQLGEIKIQDDVTNGDKFTLRLALRDDAALIAERDMSVMVTAPRAAIDSVWVTTATMASSGATLPVRIQVSNRGGGEFRDSELRFYWKDSQTVTTKSVAPLSVGQYVQIAENVVIPSGLSVLDKATLCVELWRGANMYSRKELLVVGGHPLTPVLSYDNRYPFAGSEEVYQETFFYFDKPKGLPQGGRLLAVQFPLLYSGNSIKLEDLYVEVLKRSDLIDLPPSAIQRIDPAKVLSGEFAIKEGKITFPIEPYNYFPSERDLVLRIRSKGNANLGDYFLLANKRPYTSTMVRTEYSNGKLDTILSRSMPVLEFRNAIETTFTFTVVDDANTPCANAELTIYGYNYTTDGTGTVTVPSFWEGDYSVSVFSAAHGLQTFDLALRKETPHYTIQLHAPRLLDVTCVLTTRSGKPIRDGLIRIGKNDYYTGNDGSVAVRIYEGLRDVYLYAEGYEERTVRRRITNQQTLYEFSLTPNDSPVQFEVRCMPNPVNSDLYITAPSILSLVRIFGVGGTLIAEYQPHAYNFVLDMEHLPRGFYIVEVRGNDPRKLARKRIVKY